MKNTLIPQKGLAARLAKEGIINSENVIVITPRWAESSPKVPGVQSALVRSDLIIRSDGSVVCLDGNMSLDSLSLADKHMQGKSNPQNLDWETFIRTVTFFPSNS